MPRYSSMDTEHYTATNLKWCGRHGVECGVECERHGLERRVACVGVHGRCGYAVRRTTRRAQSSFDRVLRENPLALGAAATLIGAAIGMTIPATEAENEWMGEARDNVVERARGMASEAAERVQDAAEQVKDVAGKAAQTTRPEGGASRGNTGASRQNTEADPPRYGGEQARRFDLG